MLLFVMVVLYILLSVAVWYSFPGFIQDVKEVINLLLLFSKVKITKDQLNPLNEGKLVLVSGELEMISPAIDEETDREFDFPVVRRIDETYAAVKDRKNDYYASTWGICADRTLIGCAQVGNIQIDNSLLFHIPCERYIEMVPGEKQHVLTRTNYYTYKSEQMTLIGIQKEGKLMADRRLDTQDVEPGIHSAAAICKKRCTSYMGNIILSLLEIVELAAITTSLFVL